MFGGCNTQTSPEVSRRSHELISQTDMQSFVNRPVMRSVKRSNIDIAQEFIDLSFYLEDGQELPILTKFDQPVSVSINADAPAYVMHDLDRLIGRINTEANIKIFRSQNRNANIYIETLPKRKLQSIVPTAACFVVPNVQGLEDFRRNRFKNTLDWAKLKSRTSVTIFIPNDVSPQETRDCMHEEIAQSLGPVNDLYRLPDSVYNDDNFNITLTSYDMLILAAFYAPELRNGMTKSEVSKVLPKILAKLNPVGEKIPPVRLSKSSSDWVKAIETALGPRVGNDKRRNAAFDAVRLCILRGYKDHRLGFSLFARAQVLLNDNPRLAAADFSQAYSNFRKLFGTNDIHTAQAAIQMGALSLSAGEYDSALKYVNDSIPAAKEAQNAALLFSLLTMKSEIYDIKGHNGDTKTMRKQGISWARYGLSSEKEISRRLNMIAALRPKSG